MNEKNINKSFINKLKDFSTFNPSGNKGIEKHVMVLAPPVTEKVNHSGKIVIP